jgi:hypothetical protein
LATPTVLAFACFTTPRNTHGLPRARAIACGVLDTLLGPANIPETHQRAALCADDEVVELLGRLQFATGLNRHLAVEVLDPAARQFNVLFVESPLNVQDGDLPRGHFFGIEPETHGETLLAADDDRRDTWHALEARLDLTFGHGRELQGRIPIAVQGDPDDRLRVGILFGDDRLADILGQVAAHPGDTIPHVLRRNVDVAREVELDGDAADAFAAFAAKRLDAFDVVDCLFEPFRDFGLHHLGVGAGINGGDGDNRGSMSGNSRTASAKAL